MMALVALSAFGAGVTGDDAKGAVAGWVRLREALGDEIAAEPESVATYQGRDGRGEFHVVSLKGGGYVVTSGDTGITPILGYSRTGAFDADENSPMWALLTGDVAARTAALEGANAGGSGTPRLSAAAADAATHVSEWSRLITAGKNGVPRLQSKMTSAPPDLRVPAFVQSKWGQQTARSGNGYTHNYYNNYTPKNWPCGCVATAQAQAMRYFEWPKVAVTAKTFTCKTNNVAVDLTMQGGTYDWAHMPYEPSKVTYDWNNVIGIAKLTSDVGISLCMSYKSGGSGTSSLYVGDSLMNTFGYSNAIADNDSDGIRGDTLKKNIIPSLDAKLPVILGIQGKPTGSSTSDAGHSILTDGYGYYNGQLYIHLNFGWSGSDDAWYTPSDADTGAIINPSGYNYTNIHATVFNIFTNATKYSVIASGRVLDQSGNAISGAAVTARYNNSTYATATSDERGVYALILPPTLTTSSYRSYNVSATTSGYTSTGARSVRVSRTVGDDPVKSGNNYTGSYYDRASNSNSYGNDITMEEDDLPQAATPTSATPAEFETSTNVTLVCSTSGASIYYTLDGTTPSESSTLYTGPIAITKTTTVKAIAVKSGYARSDVFTRTFVSAAAIDEYYFRHDFSGGTKVFIAGEGSGLTRDQTNSTDANAKAVEGPDGPGTAHHPGNVWGQFEKPSVLHGAWSAAMSLCMDATETGALVSFGRLNTSDQKEVALLSSSAKTNLYFKILTSDSSGAKSVENTFEIPVGVDLTEGFHTVVIAYMPASDLHDGTGSFDIYCDGVLARTVSTATQVKIGKDNGGMQYCTLMSCGSVLSSVGAVSSQTNDDVAFYDFRFFDRALTASEAAKYATAYPHKDDDASSPAQWRNNDGTGSFESVENWSGGVPRAGDFVVVVTNDTAITVGGEHSLGEMTVEGGGNAIFGGDGTIAVSGVAVEAGTSLATGGVLRFTAIAIPSASTVAITGAEGIADGGISGSGTLVVDPGAGATYTMSKNNTGFTGEAVVKSGIVKFGDYQSFGPIGRSGFIRVKGGAVLDENAQTYYPSSGKSLSKAVLEKDAELRSNPGYGQVQYSVLTTINLEGNATVDTSYGNVSLSERWNDHAVYLNLGTNTLTVIGNKVFGISYCTISGTGTIDIQDGATVESTHDYDNVSVSTTCANGTIRIREGGRWHLATYYNRVSRLSVRNLVLDGSVTRGASSYTLTVTGSITGNGTTPMLTLGPGAVFKPTGTGYLHVAEELSGTVKIDMGDLAGKSRVPLLKVPAALKATADGAIDRASVPRGWYLTVKENDGDAYYDLIRTEFSVIIR